MSLVKGSLCLLISFFLLFMLVACSNKMVKDSYCYSLIPMKGYLYLEDTDPKLFDEIHANMKRYKKRC